MANDAAIRTIRIYLPSFPLNLRFAILSDSKGILLTINNDNIMVNIISNKGDLVKELKSSECVLFPAMITEITAKALAGVGKPLKVFVCVESKLNIASRIAAHTGIMAGVIKIA